MKIHSEEVLHVLYSMCSGSNSSPLQLLTFRCLSQGHGFNNGSGEVFFSIYNKQGCKGRL